MPKDLRRQTAGEDAMGSCLDDETMRRGEPDDDALVVKLSRKAKSALGAAGHGAGHAATAVAHGAGIAAGAIAETAGGVAASVSSKAAETASSIREHSRESVVKKAKVASFRDGVNEGASLMAERAYAYSLALVALTMYAARCDGDVSEREIEHLRSSFRHLLADGNVPEVVRSELDGIAGDEELTFENVAAYLDRLPVPTLESLEGDLDDTVSADGKRTPEEEAVRTRFAEYVDARRRAEDGEDG